ncbi:uncharacterized protein DNG_04199 [Cephalotrichum gorgonifer]|uniref:Asl1-like glycosyl hydrolase catalytic domain-containing protein n=1 Tax=Cephalotrichum gorgonifer TaxID=2041049 RepID=A0AAE8MYE0_9PEZI|nr:uncharacterized protein DNG_04199 [Cephalotrichum gorgonifer]
MLLPSLPTLSTLPLLLLLLSPLAAATHPHKRGLVFTPTPDHPADSATWVQKGSALRWYYNYRDVPSPAFAGIAQEKFEFVPMMWGVDTEHPDDADFLSKVRAMIEDSVNITHALSFSEPDESIPNGGSDVTPSTAARAWVSNFEPLRKMGVKVGLPACTGGGGGLTWLQEFVDACGELLTDGGKEKKNCTWDFLPVHWYGGFDGLASHIGERIEAFPDTPIWVTEYADPNQDLRPTQDFYNTSTSWLDKEESVERYAYFGAFRSDDSTVGPNAAFLNLDGELTDVGAWYLGFNATGVDPQSGKGGAGALGAPVWGVLLLVGAMVLGMA